MQLQEDLRKHLSAECHYSEEELEAYITHKSVMVDSLWKLNVADIEATLSHVCQMVCIHILSIFPRFFLEISTSDISPLLVVTVVLIVFFINIRCFKTAMPGKRNCELELKD